jgi:hypothetical protein
MIRETNKSWAGDNDSGGMVATLQFANERNMRNNARDMRKDSTLAAIVSPTRQAVV